MRSNVSQYAFLVGASVLAACSSPKDQAPANVFSQGNTGGSPAANLGMGGKASAVGGTSSGGTSTNTSGGNPTVVGGTGGATAAGGAPAANLGGASSASGGANQAMGDITAVKRSAGCGVPLAQDLMSSLGQFDGGRTIATSGTKDVGAAGVAGPWSYERSYHISLPTNYDQNKAYPLVFQGPGCGATGADVYPLTGVAGEVIKVGLTPPPDDIKHAVAPDSRCFDDKEGDDSVEFPFYENLLDRLRTQICFDENRIFASGNSSGAWLANELGCHYAGDTRGYAIRGIMPNTGGLPTEAAWAPTCTTAPMAGLWIHETGDFENPFSGNKVAIKRAMMVNGCTIGTDYDNATFADYPIGGGQPDGTCRKILGCPDTYPLVVCELPGNGHGSHDDVAEPAFATFLKSFYAP